MVGKENTILEQELGSSGLNYSLSTPLHCLSVLHGVSGGFQLAVQHQTSHSFTCCHQTEFGRAQSRQEMKSTHHTKEGNLLW